MGAFGTDPIAGGIGAGLTSFADAYVRAKQQKFTNEKNQQYADIAERKERSDEQGRQMGLLSQGMQVGDNGDVEYNPDVQKQVEDQRQLKTETYSPESEASNYKYKELYNQAKDINPDLAEAIPKGKSHSYYQNVVEPGLLGQVKLKQVKDVAGMKNDALIELMKNKNENFQSGLNYKQDKEARTTMNNDAMMKVYVPRLEGAAKINELIESAKSGKVVSNQALLGQLNAEIARLETGSQSPGLHASEKTELNSRKAQFQALVDSFTGDPKASVDPRILNTAQKMVNELKDSYTRGIDSRVEYLKSGLNENQKGIVDEKHKSIKNTYAPRFGGKWGDEQVGEPSQGGQKGLVNNGPLSEDAFIQKFLEAKKKAK